LKSKNLNEETKIFNGMKTLYSRFKAKTNPLYSNKSSTNCYVLQKRGKKFFVIRYNNINITDDLLSWYNRTIPHYFCTTYVIIRTVKKKKKLAINIDIWDAASVAKLLTKRLQKVRNWEGRECG
jgi:hypothetical protein